MAAAPMFSMASTFKKVSGSNNYISDDIVFSILSKLSIKSLKRFSCVCKSWSHLFKNSYFINMFRNNVLSKSHSSYDDDDDCFIINWNSRTRTLSFLKHDKFEKEIKLDLPPSIFIHENNYQYFRILSSAVDGIFCLHKLDREVVLWNPVTNEVHVIPPKHPEYLGDLIFNVYLHGFGYDHVSDDYKVIRYVTVYITDSPSMDDEPMLLECYWEIYSLRNNSWRNISVDMPSSYYSKTKTRTAMGSKVYVNGVCHWLQEGDDEIYLVSFDLNNEVFFKTHIEMHVDFCFKLVVLNGLVALISNYVQATSFSISILGEIGVKESWIKLFEVGPLASVYSPIAAGKKGNIFFTIKDDERRFLLDCFDLTTGVFQEIVVNNNKNIPDIAIYKKNFDPIKGISKELGLNELFFEF